MSCDEDSSDTFRSSHDGRDCVIRVADLPFISPEEIN